MHADPTPTPLVNLPAPVDDEADDLVVIVNNTVSPPTVTPIGPVAAETAPRLSNIVRELLADGSVEIVLSDLADIDARGLQALATLRWGRDGSRSEVHFTRLPATPHQSDEADEAAAP